MSAGVVELHPGRVARVRRRELLGRFAFGAAVSALATVVGWVVDARAGGLFLAFPAILPAALTLVSKKEGREAAGSVLRGALLGAAGLVAFAVVVAATLDRWPAPLALGAGLVAWVVTSVSLYAATARFRSVEPGVARRLRTEVRTCAR